MPLTNGQGHGEHTIEKQRQFSGLLTIHTRVCRKFFKWRKHYWFIDMTAGCGVIPDTNIPGSPIRVLNAVEENLKGGAYTAYFIEKDPKNATQLLLNLTKWENNFASEKGVTECAGNWEIYQQDHHDVLPFLTQRINKGDPGILYCDMSGQIAPFDLIADFSKSPKTNKIDIIIYHSASTQKRASIAHNKPRLFDELTKINKDFYLAREPEGKHQWTFLICTNWENWPKWENKGYRRLQDDDGLELMLRLHHTRKELDDNRDRNH